MNFNNQNLEWKMGRVSREEMILLESLPNIRIKNTFVLQMDGNLAVLQRQKAENVHTGATNDC